MSDSPKGCLTVLAVVGLLAYGCVASNEDEQPATTDATSAASPSPTSASEVVVPDLVGEVLPNAINMLFAADIGWRDYETFDLSPRDRSALIDSNWTIAAQRPAAGTQIGESETVYLFYLRNEEWAWFRQHTTMPKVIPGTDTPDLDRFAMEPVDAGPLSPISELIEYRWARGEGPDYASLPEPEPGASGHGAPDDPSAEPASERAERDKLKEAHGGDIVVSSLPKPGTPLRLGQLITIIERDDEAPGSGSTGSGTSSSGTPKPKPRPNPSPERDSGDGGGHPGYTGPRCYEPGGHVWHPC